MADDKPTYRVPRTPYNSREIDLGERKDSRIPSRYGDLIFRRFDKFLIPTPTGLSATEGDVNVSLTWNTVSHHAVDGYNVYIEGQDDPLNSSIITNNAYTVSGLNANTDYDFVVTAITNTGNESSRSSPVTATYDPPPAQPIITTISESDSQIDVQWSANSESDLAGYNIYLDGTKHNSSLITAESYSFTGLNNGQSYLIELEAVDNAGSASPKGSVTGTPAIQSVNNYSAEFDGVDDYIEVSDTNNSLDITGDLTLESWIYPLTSSTGDHALTICKRAPAGTANYQFWVRKTSNSGEWEMHFYDDSSIYGVLTTSINVNQWNHVSVVRSGTDIFFYVGGTQVGSVSNVGIGPTNDNPFFIGTDNSGNFSNSRKDEVRLWNTSRTQSEIQNNMNSELSGTESGLVGYWKLNEGLPLAYDKAGGNHGTVNGGVGQSTDVPFSGDNRYSTVFDGVDDEINLGDSSSLRPNANFPQSMTVEFWFKADSNISDSNRFWLLGKGSSSANDSIHTDISNGKIIFYLDTVDKTGNVDILTNYSKDRWYHLALVYDGSEVRVYIDGNLEVTDTGFGGNIADASGSPWTIGYRQGTGYYYYGQIDDVRIWNTDRTQTQIQNNFQSELNGDEQGLVAYWTFDEYAEDATANNNHGLLKGNVGYSVDVPFVTEFTSHSLDFDGTDDYVSVGSQVIGTDMTQSFSVDAWIKSFVLVTNNPHYIIAEQLASSPYQGVSFSINGNGELTVFMRTGDGSQGESIAQYYDLDSSYEGRWVHVGFNYDGSLSEKGIDLFINGKVVAPTRTLEGTLASTMPVAKNTYIGSRDGTNNYMEEHIDEVRVYGKVRTDQEIRDSMKKNLSDLTNVVGYWKFDEGSGSTATDETGNNDGTINGATYSTDTPD